MKRGGYSAQRVVPGSERRKNDAQRGVPRDEERRRNDAQRGVPRGREKKKNDAQRGVPKVEEGGRINDTLTLLGGNWRPV